MRRLRATLANKDAIIAGFEADRITYQGLRNANFLNFLYQAFHTANISSNADAINKAKDIVDNVGSIDRLRDENIELNKLNEAMPSELKTAKKNLAKAEKALEAERQEHKDALREI